MKNKLAATTVITSTSTVSNVGDEQPRSCGESPVQCSLPTALHPVLRPGPVYVRTPIFMTPSVAARTVWMRQPLGISQGPQMQSPVVVSTPASSLPNFASLMSQASVCSVTSTAAYAVQSIASGLRVIQANGGQTPVYVQNINPSMLNYSTAVLMNSQISNPVPVVNTSAENAGITTDENSPQNKTPKIFIINGKSYVLSGRTTVDGIATLIPLPIKPVDSSNGSTPISLTAMNTQQMSPLATQNESNQKKYFDKKVTLSNSTKSTKLIGFSKYLVVTKTISANQSQLTTASVSNFIPRNGQIPQHPVLRSTVAKMNTVEPTVIRCYPSVQPLTQTNNTSPKESAAPSNKSSVPSLLLPRPGTSESPQSISSEEETNPLLENLPSPIPDDSVRPMLLFRHDIARNLKPAFLRQYYETNNYKKSPTSQQSVALSISSSSSTNYSKAPQHENNTKITSVIKTAAPTSQNMSVKTMNGGMVEVSPATLLSLSQNKPGFAKVDKIFKRTLIKKKSNVATMTVGSASQTLKRLSALSFDKPITKQAISPQVIKMRSPNSVIKNLSHSQVPLMATSKNLNRSKEDLLKPSFGYEKGTHSNEPVLQCLSNNKLVAGKSTLSELVGTPTNSDSIDVPNGSNVGSNSDNDSSSLRISSVFSLRPTVEDNITKESVIENQSLLQRQSVKCTVPGIKIIDSPSKHTRKTTKEAGKEMVSLLHQMNSKGLNEKQTNSNLRPADKMCRVVLRRLNMKKIIQRPFTCIKVKEALPRSRCSKRCRQIVLSAYYEHKDDKNEYKNIQRGERSRRTERLIPFIVKIPKGRSRNSHKNSPKRYVVNLIASSDGSVAKLDKVPSTKEKIPICISTSAPVTVPQINVAKSSSGDRPRTAHLSSNASARIQIKDAEVLLKSATAFSRPVPSVSVKPLGSADNSNYRICQIGDKLVLVPTASLENALKSLVKKTSSSSMSTTSTNVVGARSLPNVTASNGSVPASTAALVDNAVSTFLSLPSNTTPVTAPYKQNMEIKSEPVTSGYSEHIEAGEPLVKVKSEPLHRGYSDKGKTLVSQASSVENSRKRRLEVDDSGQQAEDTPLATEQQNMDSDMLRPFTISETPHTEKIRRLKEQLKQKQDALEEIRVKRISSMSTPREDTEKD